MQSCLEYYLDESYEIDEKAFMSVDFSHRGAFDYLSNVLKSITNGETLSLGKDGTYGTVDFSDPENRKVAKQLSTAIDFDKINVDNAGQYLTKFNSIVSKATPSEDSKIHTVKWQRIWKQPYSGEDGRLGHEYSTVSSLNQQIKTKKKEKDSIQISCNDGNIYDITSVEKVPGTSKADIVLKDKDGKECIWISLKKGTTIKQFGGYGGISQKYLSKAKENKSIEQADIELAEEFAHSFANYLSSNNIEHFKGHWPSQDETENYKISPNLQRMALYGKESDLTGKEKNKEFSKDKCNYVIQTDSEKLKIEEIKDGIYVLTGAHILSYPEIPHDDYEPVFGARTANDRQSYGLKGIRIGIFPKGFLPKTSNEV